MNTVEQLKDMLIKHDWWYCMSDSSKVYREGSKNWDNMFSIADSLDRLDILKEAVRAFNSGEDIQKAIKEM